MLIILQETSQNKKSKPAESTDTFTTTIELDSNNEIKSIFQNFNEPNPDILMGTTQEELVTECADSHGSERDMGTEPQSSLKRGLAEATKFLYKSVKPSTRHQYDRIYKIWVDFCAENNLQELEAGHEAVAACLSLVMLEGSLSKVNMLAAAIANEHRIHLKNSPTKHESISQLFRAFRLNPHKVRDPVLPLTDDILKRMIQHLYQPKHGHQAAKASLVLWRTVWRVVMEYHTLGRWDDVSKLKRSDLQFQEEPTPHLKVKFKEGKTDMYNEGSTRIVAADMTERAFCPVQLSCHYLKFLGSGHFGFLVPACSPKGCPDQQKAASYTSCLEDLRELLKNLGVEGRYGEHSGKRGGATQAAENGMTMPQLKRFGGWRSDDVPQQYVDLTIRARIEMSKMLHKKL